MIKTKPKTDQLLKTQLPVSYLGVTRGVVVFISLTGTCCSVCLPIPQSPDCFFLPSYFSELPGIRQGLCRPGRCAYRTCHSFAQGWLFHPPANCPVFQL
jgi:hypothetical protein